MQILQHPKIKYLYCISVSYVGVAKKCGKQEKWLNPKTPLSEITKLLRAFPANKMNAYPISPEISDPKNNKRELIEPIGERLTPEIDLRKDEELKLFGMGRYKTSR